MIHLVINRNAVINNYVTIVTMDVVDVGNPVCAVDGLRSITSLKKVVRGYPKPLIYLQYI
jgi:3-keto-L-gulonate-6-phosphate decarboxylase